MWSWSLVHLVFISWAELLCASWKESFSDCGSSTEGSEARLLWLTAEYRVQHFLWEQHINNFLTFYPHNQKQYHLPWNVRKAKWMIEQDQNEGDHVTLEDIQSEDFIQWIFFSYVNAAQQQKKPHNKQSSLHKTWPFYTLSFSFPNQDKRNSTKCFCSDCLWTAEAIRHPAGEQGESEAFPSRSQWGSGGKKHRGA